MIWRLLRPLRGARVLLLALRRRGIGAGAAVPMALAAVVLRGWRRVARPVNRVVLGRLSNGPRFARFQQGLAPAGAAPRFYVTVMPDVLHFLLPCLALLRGRLPLVLLANGAARWEMRMLAEHLPEAPQFRLHALPASSVDHGDVLSLLIEHVPAAFGVIDHDCYVFDRSVLSQWHPRAGEYAVTLFDAAHEPVDLRYPLTHCLVVDGTLLRALAHEHGVDARLYRHAPPGTHGAFSALGLAPDTPLKPYQRFHDTLHLLALLALARGHRLRTLEARGELPFAHIGGTSIGSHHTKDLFALHTHLRFAELLGEAHAAAIRCRRLTQPLRVSGDALVRRGAADAGWEGAPLLERMLPLLAAALHAAWPERYPPPS